MLASSSAIQRAALTLALLLPLAGALGACGDDDTPGTDGGPGSDAGPGTDGGGTDGFIPDFDAGPCGVVCSAPTTICRESDSTCVQCLDDAACTDPTANKCSEAGLCVGCTDDVDCEMLTATPVCDEAGGACVACTPDSEETTCPPPDSFACHPVDFTCTGATRGTISPCQSCAADSECAPMGATVRRCVPFSFGGMDLGAVCLTDQATTTDMMCPVRFADPRAGTSASGTDATYCFPRHTTCDGLGSVSRTCTMDSECGNSALDDTLCRDDGGGLRCTYQCTDDSDCAGSLCSTADPRYCCTAGTGPGCS